MNKPEEYRTKTFQIGNVTVTIHQPILTQAERTKREEAVRTALRNYGRAIMKN